MLEVLAVLFLVIQCLHYGYRCGQRSALRMLSSHGSE